MDSKREVKLNINQYVRYRLTARGERLLREREWHLAAPDEPSGWRVDQLWTIMNQIGPHIGLGLDPPIETEIFIRPEQ